MSQIFPLFANIMQMYEITKLFVDYFALKNDIYYINKGIH